MVSGKITEDCIKNPLTLYDIKIPLLYCVTAISSDTEAVEASHTNSKKITFLSLNLIQIAEFMNRKDIVKIMVDTLIEYGLKEKSKPLIPSFVEEPTFLLDYVDLSDDVDQLTGRLLNGFPVDKPDRHGQSLFKCAVVNKNKRAIQALLAFGADINQKLVTKGGRTSNALFHACDHQELEWVKFWLEHGADVNGIKNVCYPILSAAERPNVEILKLLLNQDSLDLTVLDPEQGINALHYAAIHPKTIKILSTLVETKKIDINSVSRRGGNTALVVAVTKNNLPAARYLIAQKADPNVQTHRNTPLVDSIVQQFNDMTELLILQGKADVNLVNRGSRDTPLMMAIFRNNLRIVKLLLERGANPTVRNAKDLGLLDCALSHENDAPEMLKYLFENQLIPEFLEIEGIQNHGPNNVLMQAAEMNKIKSLKLLLTYNTYGKKYIFQALCKAKKIRNKECEKILLQAYIEALCQECFNAQQIAKEVADNIQAHWCKILLNLHYILENDHIKFIIPRNSYIKEGIKYNNNQELYINTENFPIYNNYILTMLKTETLEEVDVFEVVFNTTPEYKALQEELDIKQAIQRRNTLIEAATHCEMRFTKAIRHPHNIQHETTVLMNRCDDAKEDVMAINAILEQTEKGPAKPNKNPNKRDRSQGKVQSNLERFKSIAALKSALQDLQSKAEAIKKNFFEHYEKNLIDLEEKCHEERFLEAEKILKGLEEYLIQYNALQEVVKELQISLESIHDAILGQFSQEARQNRAVQKETDRLQARAQAILEAKTAEEKKQVEEAQNENLMQERLEKEDALRRQRYAESRAAYLKEKEQKKKREEIRQRHLAFLSHSALSAHQSMSFTTPEKSIPSANGEGLPLLLFSKRTPRPLTLNMAGGDIAEQVSHLENKQRVENETVCLELCVEAAVEMNRSLDEKKTDKEKLILLKMQRNALLGTFAQCMEYLKRLKNDPVFSSTMARKLRNYLFKGKRFLLHEKQKLEEVKHINAKLIHMINEIIFCMRTEELDGIDSLTAIDSDLFKELQQAAQNLEQEKAPSLMMCKQGIQLANLEFKLYEGQENTNPLILEGARNYSLAARGTFAMWIRDFYPRSYHETAAYKNELEGYITDGNQVRHGETAINGGNIGARSNKATRTNGV